MVNWSKRKVGSLGRVVTGNTPPTKEKSNFDGPYPFITVPDLDGHVLIENTARTLSEKGAQMVHTCRLPKNTIMLSCIATIGKCGLTTQEASYTNQSINSVIPNDDVSPRFLYYAFRQLEDHLESIGGGGSVFPRVSKSSFSNVEISLPKSRNEQEEIASILGSLDDKIAINCRMNETLEAMSRVLFKDWFVDFEPTRAKMEGSAPYLAWDIWDLFPNKLDDEGKPEGWEIKTVGECLKRLKVGKTYTQKLVEITGKIPVLNQSKSGIAGYHNNKPNVPASIEDRVSVFTDLTCRQLLVDFDFSATQNIIPFVGLKLPTEWIHYASLGKQELEDYRGHWSAFVAHEVTVPNLELASAFSNFIDPLLSMMSANQREEKVLASTRDLLLPKLMSGEIRVADADELAVGVT